MTCCMRRASQAANSETLVMRNMPMRMLYAYRMFDRATYTQNRPVMPRNCRLLRPPANRRGEESVFPDPIMGRA